MKKLTIRHTILLATTALWLILSLGCKPEKTVENEGHSHSAHGGHEEEVHLLQQQMEVMGIELGQFQYLDLSATVKASGHLELPPQNKASLSAVMRGRVKQINVLEGDYVKKGQTLALLEHPDFIEMQEQYLASGSQLRFLEKEYLRKQQLFGDSISSAKAYEQAESAYRSALAKVNGLKAKLQMLDIDMNTLEQGRFVSDMPVRSLINGYVRSIKINIGMFVRPEQEMFEILDNEHIHLDLMVYANDIDQVKNGQKVIFSLTNATEEVFQGEIFAVGKSFEQEPKAMRVHAEIENKTGNLLPGMYVDARIVVREQKVKALPDDAIVTDGGLPYIFVLKPSSGSHIHQPGEAHDNEGSPHEEHVFRKIEVSTGIKDIGYTEVVPAYNLPDHIKIVTKGAFYLLAEMKKGEGGHGHHH